MTDREPTPGTSGRRRFDPLPEWTHPGTRLIHASRRPELNAGAVVAPIYQTSTYHYPPTYSEAAGKGDVHYYTRMDNPSHEVAAELVRTLEGGEEARVFGSGMGAITTTLLSCLRAGDEVVALEELYGGTLELLRDLLPRYGVRVRWVTQEQAAEPESAVGPRTRVVFLETPTNPTLHVHDLRRWAAAADAAGAVLLVDNTFATPINQRPLEHGADLVVHSATKYLGGHADLMAGVVVGPTSLVSRIDEVHHVVGSVLDPFAAFLLARGLRTLALRVARQNENGRKVAEALAQHPKVALVHYPGRASESEEEVARRQMAGRGGMVALSLSGGEASARKFLKALRFVHVASSLGGVESLASMPKDTSHRTLAASERTRRGIDEGVVRLSLGIEEPDDLVRDITEALDQV